VGYRIIVGDCVEGLRTIDACSVQCCVTSPPYYGLRDYGHEGQIGLEETPEDYITKMVEVFREVKRVLRDDGTLWLNIGDSYWAGKGSNGSSKARATAEERGYAQSSGTVKMDTRPTDGKHDVIKAKDLIGIPWMLAFALRADGWYLRQDIIWHKPNPMPESVADRCTKAHEYVFLLSKSARYYYDAEAVKEPSVDIAGWQSRMKYKLSGSREGSHPPDDNRYAPQGYRDAPSDNAGRNRRSVWSVTTKPFKGAHFAVMPEDLVEPCVLAGTGARGCCSKCGMALERIVEAEAPDGRKAIVSGGRAYDEDGNPLMGDNMIDKGVRGSFSSNNGATLKRTTIGWKPQCDCGADVVPCVVLDPFTGSGTTAVVALRHNLDFVGCELNEEYVKVAHDRIVDDASLFNFRDES
jgi:DNA modification methylase